jgi:hypothetical protein
MWAAASMVRIVFLNKSSKENLGPRIGEQEKSVLSQQMKEDIL